MIRRRFSIRSVRILLIPFAVVASFYVGRLASAGGVPGSISLPSYCDSLSSQPAATQQQCDQLKRQAFEGIQATALAQPYSTSVVTPVNPAISGTPVPLGYIPSQDQVIQALTPSAAVGAIGGHPTHLTSVWQAGAILNLDPTSPDYQRGYGLVLVYAVGPNTSNVSWVGEELFDAGGAASTDRNKYASEWACPQNVGAITITQVTGPNGIVSFTSSSGLSGTLNMATGAWTFKS